MTETPTPGVWATPTPFPTVVPGTPVIELGNYKVQAAESIVQGYHTLDSYGVAQPLQFGIIFLIVLMGVVTITRKIKAM